MKRNIQELKNIDEHLSQFTDALLTQGEGNLSMDLPEEAQELEETIRQVAKLLGENSIPTPQFQAKLTRKLSEEWEHQHLKTRKNHRLQKRLSIGLAFAAMLFAIVAFSLLWSSYNPNAGDSSATASDGDSTILLALGLVLLMGGFFWFFRRRH